MGLGWNGGDQMRRTMASAELQRAGLSPAAAAALFSTGVFTVEELVRAPWSDEDAGRRFASLQWRLSVSAGCSTKLVRQVATARERLIESVDAEQRLDVFASQAPTSARYWKRGAFT